MKKIYNLLPNLSGNKICLTFILFLLSFTFSLKAQTFLKTVIVGDTIKLSVTGANGSIQWQESTDSLSWTDMAGFTNSLETFTATTSPTGKKFYRAKITDTLCPNATPFYSSIIRNKIVANTSEVVVGNWFHGGIVFYTDSAGNGLIAPQQDQSSGVQWGCYGTGIPGAVSLTNGATNTTSIIAACATRPIAASICDQFSQNGYNDWFLPAQNQLNYLYLQRSLVGGFSTNYYWSSSEFNGNGAWRQSFSNGDLGANYKLYTYYVRCVRSFSNIDISPIGLPETATITDQPVTVELTTQPANHVKCKGSSVTFTVAASGTTIFYQWKKGGINISNATSTSYTINNLTATDEGIYTCEASNICRSITSDNAELKVIDLNVDAGADFTFCNDTVTHLIAVATTNHTVESGTLNYSWTPTTALGSPDSASTTAQPTGNTTYTFSVTDLVGCTKTDAIVVTSKTPVSITTQPLSYNKCLNSNVTFTLNATGTAPISYVWKKNGTPISGATSNTYSINGLGLADESTYTCEPTNYCRTLSSNNAELKVINLNVDAGADFTFCNDTTTHLIANATTNHTAESGTLNYSWTPTTALGSPDTASTTAQPTGNITYTISVTDQAGCAKTDTVVVTSKTPVSITTQPLSYNKCLNSNVTFTLNATGTAPISYVWKKNGTIISGATLNTYSIYSLGLSAEGIYICEPTNYCRTLSSNNAELKVINLNVNAGADFTYCNDTTTHLIATATTNHTTESGTLNYSWTPTATLGSPTSVTTTAHPTSNTTYTIYVTDQVGCTKTDAIVVTSKTPVSITTQPLSYNKCLNSNVTFTLNATGTVPISYVWKKNGTIISGATSNTYSINGLGLADEGTYTCEPTNYCRTLSSNNAGLKIINLNVDAGADFIYCNDTITHLIANATTNHPELGTLNYSWSPITTLGSSTSAITTAQPTSNTTYTISVTDQAGCAKTDTIIVTSYTPVSITTQPLSNNICLNSNVTFTISSSGTEPIIYQWKHDGNDINGANSNTFEISNLSLSEEGIYTCDISNYCNNLQSNNSILKVVELTIDAGSDEHICNNNSIGLLASANTNHSVESGVLNYTWSPSSGLSSPVVNNPDANPTITTNYSVTVSDQIGCSDTDSVQVLVQNVFQDEEICLVTVDVNTWKNKIIWGKTADMGTAGYTIYKEVGTNIYSGIGYVAFSDSSEFIDYSSNPESYSNRYKIVAVDTCGVESEKSYFHKSINLTIAAFGSTMGLNWNDYIDESGLFIPVNYFIFKGTSPSNMQLIDSVPGGTNSYNDNNVFNLYYYIVGVKKENGCYTAKSSLVSFSNKKDNSVFVGIDSISGKDNELIVSPNPFSESTTLIFKNSDEKSIIVSIIDLTGKIVRIYKNITSEKLVIEKRELKSGVYFVEVSGEKKYRGKLIIE